MHATPLHRCRAGLWLPVLLTVLATTLRTPVHAQLPVWTDNFHGGVVVGNFSLGSTNFGGGTFTMPIPAGSTVRKATLYGIEVGGNLQPTIVKLNGVEYLFGPATTASPFTYIAPPYGTVQLHQLDLTTTLDPTVMDYAVVVPPTEAMHNHLVDFCLVVAYERPADDEVWADLFWCDKNSAEVEAYTVTTTAPMLVNNGVAFATMASYCRVGLQDCEYMSVNGTALGSFGGNDENAVSPFGASASLKYSGDEFTGLADDDVDLAVNGPDVLADISTLLSDQASTFQVTYTHCPSGSPDDNLMNLMLVAYSSSVCLQTVDLGPDTLLCAGETILLDASRPNATYTWQDGSTDPTYTVSAPGTYAVQLAHPSCSWPPDTVVVGYRPVLDAELGPDLVLCEGQSTMLHVQAQNGAKYIWSNGEVGPALEVDAPGTYHLTASMGRCAYSDSITVSMDPCQFAVDLPNIFTPNGDGSNAYFAPVALRGVQRMHISVFNRWGQELFTSTQPDFRWYGRSAAGSEVPDGVYYWVLRYVAERGDGQERSLTGTVTITR
ncbi:MAG: gliding motility-associated C-terminal domain-containing protein [Flavobacteriales bacterium]|nr:gliding motility-associated C-terminal domain-containing protein [Flavobacteriales bacterium]